MGRPKSTKNKELNTVQETPKQENVNTEAGQSETDVKPEIKTSESKNELTLVKTLDRELVVAANELKYSVVHVSGSGSPHNPKIFFLSVNLDKLAEKVGDDKMNNAEPADKSEIDQLIVKSRNRGIKELKESGAQKRKMDQEIQPSQFFDA